MAKHCDWHCVNQIYFILDCKIVWERHCIIALQHAPQNQWFVSNVNIENDKTIKYADATIFMLLLLFHYHILINYDRLSGISFVCGECGDIQMNIKPCPRFCCRPPPSCSWCRCGRRAASSSCGSSTPPTAWASGTLQTHTPARSFTSDLTSLPWKTFKKWWILRNSYCYLFKRYQERKYCSGK